MVLVSQLKAFIKQAQSEKCAKYTKLKKAELLKLATELGFDGDESKLPAVVKTVRKSANGKKRQLKPCRENQYRHPITNRCRNNTSSASSASSAQTPVEDTLAPEASPSRSGTKETSPPEIKKAIPFEIKKVKKTKSMKPKEIKKATTFEIKKVKKTKSMKPKEITSKRPKKIKYWRSDMGELPNGMKTDRFDLYKLSWERLGFKVIRR
jgi:hypothetical protein